MFPDLVRAMENPATQLGAIAGIANLVADSPANQKAVLDGKFISVVSPLVGEFSADKEEQTLRILMHLASEQESNQKLVSLGVIVGIYYSRMLIFLLLFYYYYN